MATRIPTTPTTMRKHPRQARSRATVDAIVTAGSHVLARRGWSGFTTNEVAEIAGASIGSLYQYFPNKLALIAAIKRRHFDDVLAVLQSAQNDGARREDQIEALVTGMIAIHGNHPGLHRVLLEEIPHSGGSSAAEDAFEAEYFRRYEIIVAASADIRRPSPREAARVLAAAVEGVVHDAARRGALDSAVMKDELVRLIRAYLNSRSF